MACLRDPGRRQRGKRGLSQKPSPATSTCISVASPSARFREDLSLGGQQAASPEGGGYYFYFQTREQKSFSRYMSSWLLTSVSPSLLPLALPSSLLVTSNSSSPLFFLLSIPFPLPPLSCLFFPPSPFSPSSLSPSSLLPSSYI